MAHYQFNDDEARADWSELGSRVSHAVVRGFGFLLMLVGLWISLAVIAEAWSLYRQPAKIERLALAIEQGSNLDRALSRVSQNTQQPNEAASATTAPPAAAGQVGFRITYFVAWIIAILLLMLVGRLSIAAVKTGGELVLYDGQFRKFARELVREAAKREAA